jgi:hypothetical protein
MMSASLQNHNDQKCRRNFKRQCLSCYFLNDRHFDVQAPSHASNTLTISDISQSLEVTPAADLTFFVPAG